jgi:hypothetical protein
MQSNPFSILGSKRTVIKNDVIILRHNSFNDPVVVNKYSNSKL